jgi:hypothetical protein
LCSDTQVSRTHKTKGKIKGNYIFSFNIADGKIKDSEMNGNDRHNFIKNMISNYIGGQWLVFLPSRTIGRKCYNRINNIIIEHNNSHILSTSLHAVPSQICYTLRTDYPHWCDHPNNVSWKVQIMNLFVMQSSPASRHFPTLRSKYFPHDPVLNLNLRSSHPIGTRDPSPGGKAAGAWSLPLTTIQCRGRECVELHPHSAIRLHAMVLS